MDYTVKWSPEATEDLESIADYIARDSEFYARSVVSKILTVSREISEFPLIGSGCTGVRERGNKRAVLEVATPVSILNASV